MAAPTDAQRSPDRTLTYAAIIIVAGVLATTLAQPQVLARLPLQNLLKNELHLDRSSNAAFFFWAGLAWYLKPFAGIVTDAFPLFGNRRKSYILLSATLRGAGMVGADCHPTRIPPPAVRRDRHQRVHGGNQHGGRRLHGGNRAGDFGLRPPDRNPAVRSAGVPDRQRAGCGISRQHRLRLDRGGVRRDHVPAGAGHRCCFCGSSGNRRTAACFWATPEPSLRISRRRGRCGPRRG